MDKIKSHLQNSKNVLVVSHANPDGDAIGSLIAMGLALKAIGKKTTLYNESSIPAVYRFLPAVNSVVREIGNQNFDTAVILDCGDLERIGEAVSMVRRIPVIINIDHHATNAGFGNLQLIDTSACATAEIVYRLIKQLSVSIDENIATSIYTGILTDTGSFRFSNTNKAAFAICEEMVALGVDPYKIAQRVYGTYSLGRIKLLNLALDSIEISYNGRLSIMTLTQNMLKKTRTQSEDVDGLINYARRIEDVKVAALIQEYQNGDGTSETCGNYHVSLRSDGTIDVAEIASSFGGGGHSSAAGFNIESTLTDLKLKIFNLAERL
jgi:bifunctional oligoribonuclease and PAP phosphatase NrnA